MGNPPRCKTCHHPRGPRRSQLTKADKNSPEGHPKKPPCSCECHAT
jgi:hypothetical protein